MFAQTWIQQNTLLGIMKIMRYYEFFNINFFKIPHKISYKMLKINFILIKNEKNLLLKVAAVTKAQKMNR